MTPTAEGDIDQGAIWTPNPAVNSLEASSQALGPGDSIPEAGQKISAHKPHDSGVAEGQMLQWHRMLRKLITGKDKSSDDVSFIVMP